jgi:alanine racemase
LVSAITGYSDIPRPNWVEIDLDALIQNLKSVGTLAGVPHLILPVKADAYGHGSLACSFAVEKSGAADALGVAHLFEAITLREWGIRMPILVLGPCLQEEFPLYLRHQITPTLASLEDAQALDQFLQDRSTRLDFHLKVNTGMNRYGIRWDALSEIQSCATLQHAHMQGVYTHLAIAENAAGTFNVLQKDRWKQVLNALPNTPMQIHLSNSADLLQSGSHTALDQDKNTPLFNWGRPGLAAFGCSPIPARKGSDYDLKPVLKMQATLRQILQVETGEGVSYGQHWIATETTRVGAVAIGYGDGFPRNPNATQEGEAPFLMVRGKACPILGSVCMDTTLIDLSNVPDAQTGDEVEVMNADSHPGLSVEAWAEMHQTIPYEITCGIARRLYRIYRWQGKLWRWNDLREALGVTT